MADSREVVILLHGLGMTGLELFRIRRALVRAGFGVEIFRYASTRRAPAANAAQLCRRIEAIDAKRLHFVAHSLGGIVLTHLFAHCPAANARTGRVLMLGTPLAGSALANFLQRHRTLRWLLGQSLNQGLLGDHPPWSGPSELAMITGDIQLGPTLLFPGILKRPNDGTVATDETRDAAVRQRLNVPYSHTGMLFSVRVAGAIVRYLRTGRLAEESDTQAANAG